MDVPLSVAGVTRSEREAVIEVLNSGKLKGAGPQWEQANEKMETAFGADKVMMTTSCTHALEMAAILLEDQPGDEVIVPSYTFPSTATAFARRGAEIRFCEVKSETLNMDPEYLEEIISSDTAVVVPVHYAGVACEMDSICSIADKHGAAVVEDAAQGVNASYRGSALGTIGDLGCYSFHESKSLSAGEGGALLVNDESLVERAEYVFHKGTNYAKFSRGEVDRYTWVDIGSSYAPTEIQAALACTQLDRREEIRTSRRTVHDYYHRALSGLQSDGVLRLPDVPEDRKSNYHLYHILTDTRGTRNELMKHLREHGIGAASHYEPLHSSRMGREYGYAADDLSLTEELAGRLLRLPIHQQLDETACERVVSEIKAFYDDRE